ncbi:MAG: sugar transferase [Verrucomicrobia bacterium]|jgi:lipopolysaccharide/colanic/teichoic acid biosynthesis glycosyltransferase|nr:sugar transferase [Verrucomicrobiota bacterium]
MKRLFDIVASGLAILAFLPVGIVLALLLRFTGEGEVFYRQNRVGRNGKTFGVLKFATMLKDSPKMGTGTITTKDDPRVLPMGRFLRKTKLNEVPQLWNIFVGDMSVVGPRPLTKETRDYIPVEILNEIQDVQPGLTGIGSIVFRDEENIIHESGEDYHTFYKREIAPFKGEVELWYKRNKSFLMDIKIIFVTALVVLFSGHRAINRWFPDLPAHPIFNPHD